MNIFRRYLARRRTAKELHALDDRALNDLGITRGQIDIVVQRLVN